MKYMKKTLVLVMVLAMMLSLGMSAYALGNPILGGTAFSPLSFSNPLSAVSAMPNPNETSDPINVTLIIEAPDEYFDEEGGFAELYYNVQIGTTYQELDLNEQPTGLYSIHSLLRAFDDAHTDYTFTYSNAGGTLYQLKGIAHNGTTWMSGPFDLWGWAFRLNDKVPVYYNSSISGYEGGNIKQTYLTNGDVVHLFWDDPETLDGYEYGAQHIRLIPGTLSASSVSATIQGHHTAITENDLQMLIDNYQIFYTDENTELPEGEENNYLLRDAETTVRLYCISDYTPQEVASGIDISVDDESFIAEAETENGEVSFTFTGNDLLDTSKVYALIAVNTLLDDADEPMDYSGFLFDQTSGYILFTVS